MMREVDGTENLKKRVRVVVTSTVIRYWELNYCLRRMMFQQEGFQNDGYDKVGTENWDGLYNGGLFDDASMILGIATCEW